MRLSTGPELAFLYVFGLLGALQINYDGRVRVGVLVYTHIGFLDHVENEPAEFFIKALHLLPWPACAHNSTAALPHAACCVRACERVRRGACVRACRCVRACGCVRADACVLIHGTGSVDTGTLMRGPRCVDPDRDRMCEPGSRI